MPGRTGEVAVTGPERRVERFCERDVNSIIGRQIVPQFPDARQKEIVRIPEQRKIGQVGERLSATLRIEFAGCRIPTDDLRDFDVEQMGRV